MSGHEARINDALKQLGEEFRLGMVAAEEYRARRRLLLESWGERDATTSPGGRSRLVTTTAPPPPNAGPRAATPERRPTGLVIAGIVGAALIAAAAYVLWQPPAPQTHAATATPPPPPVSMELIAIRRAAEDFLARNAWDAAPIGAFLEQWRRLSPAERARAREEPSLRTLRHELDQNIQVEAQLVAPDAPPEARARLDLLTNFARELGG